MDTEQLLDPAFWQEKASSVLELLIGWFTSPQFYAQIGAIVAAYLLAKLLTRLLNARVNWFNEKPKKNDRWFKVRSYVFAASDLLFPALFYLLLGLAVEGTAAAVGADWLVRLARGASVIYLLYRAINRFITNSILHSALIYIGIPVATLQVFGWLDDTIAFLDSLSFQAGNIRLSVYFLIKAAIVGGFFFWLGSISNRSGQNVIRSQNALDLPTQELFAKLFQIVLFAVLFVLLLQVLGLDLTALAIFGGALGVGIGFGLQQIASNFISGIILLVERTLTVGDFIELEDGRMGTMKALNMRSATLETFDGKEIMVPNEKFITNTFVNWTRDDPRQRYEVPFSVVYGTDLRSIPPLIEEAVSKHPGVLQEPEKPDCELRGFGQVGVDFAVEFWIKGIDDGKNRISSDLLFIIWETLEAAGVKVPTPQRVVRILEDPEEMRLVAKQATKKT